MRTTVELPPELMRAAKARSAERGESLKTLMTRAIAAELAMPAAARRKGERVKLPLLGSGKGPRVHLTNRYLEDALAHADAEEMAIKMGRPLPPPLQPPRRSRR